MSKDMNVTIWPIWQSGVDDTEYADVGQQWPINVGYQMYAKRLTDTELAAEVWHAVDERTRDAGNILSGQHDNPYAQAAFQRSIDRAATMHNFAVRPHAAENDYA